MKVLIILLSYFLPLSPLSSRCCKPWNSTDDKKGVDRSSTVIARDGTEGRLAACHDPSSLTILTLCSYKRMLFHFLIVHHNSISFMLYPWKPNYYLHFEPKPTKLMGLQRIESSVHSCTLAFSSNRKVLVDPQSYSASFKPIIIIISKLS